MQLHLDSEYRNRHQTFHLLDGTIENSRFKNWRQVEWEKVIRVDTSILNYDYKISLQEIPEPVRHTFKGFMNFRCGGRIAKYDGKGKFERFDPIHTWVTGWTDGVLCYLAEIDFYTGKVLRHYKDKLDNLRNHLHPRLVHFKEVSLRNLKE